MIKVEIIEKDNTISNGIHYLSGYGEFHREFNDYYHEHIDGIVFCIDGVNYEAYVDPDDGYRSYSAIYQSKEKCEVTFEPQPVFVTNKKITGKSDDDEWGWEEDKHILVITDAVNNKVVLEVGTDFTEDYYPCGFYHWFPQNMNINANR